MTRVSELNAYALIYDVCANMRSKRFMTLSHPQSPFLDESGHEPQLRAVHASGATAKEAKMGGEARPSGSGVGLMHRLPCVRPVL